MRKGIKKSFMIILGVLVFGGIPNMVSAAEFSFGSDSKVDNVTSIPVALEVGSGEVITKAKFSCETDNTEVSCKIVSKDPSNVTVLEDGSGLNFQYLVDETNKGFPEGTTTLAVIELTNESASKLSNVKLTLKNASIEGAAVEKKSIFAEVNAKPAEKVLSDDAKLKDIKVSQGAIAPVVMPDVYEYTVYNIADTINSIKITPICNDGETCSYTIDGGKSVLNNTTVMLNQGANTVKILVSSENGQNNSTYTLTIYRGETPYNSVNLESLSFGDYTLTPAFSKDVDTYTITIPYNVNSLINIIKYQAEDKNATVDVKGLDNLVVGTNTITITIDNVNKDATKTITITVNRLSQDAIEVIKYIDDEVTFKDADGIQTTLPIKEFSVQYPEEYKNIINNVYKFDDKGNIIKDVPKEDEPVDKNTEKKKKDNKWWLIILLVIGGIIIIVVSGILIFKQPKDEKDKAKNEKKTTDDDKEKVESVSKKELDENVLKTDVEIDETGIEEKIIGQEFSKDVDTTVDIDVALRDLMDTKQYEFEDKDE